MSDSLWPHELQHARLPCPSPSPGVCSNSCSSSWKLCIRYNQHVDHFWVYASVALSTFTLFCSQHHHPLPEVSLLPSGNSVPINPHHAVSPRKAPFYFLSLWAWPLWLPHVSGIMECMHFGDWLVSCNIMLSGFNCVVVGVRITLFLRPNDIPVYAYTTFCLSILLLKTTFWLFSLLAIVNSAAISMEMKRPLWVPAFNSFGYMLRGGIARPYGDSLFNFLRKHHNVSK